MRSSTHWPHTLIAPTYVLTTLLSLLLPCILICIMAEVGMALVVSGCDEYMWPVCVVSVCVWPVGVVSVWWTS